MQHLPKYVSERRSAWIAQEPVRLDVIRTQSEPYRNPKEPFSIACQNPFSFHLCWRNCFEHIPSLLPRARGLTTADTVCPLETPFNCTIARWIDKRLEHNYIAVYSLYRKKHETYHIYIYSMYYRWLDLSQSTIISFVWFHDPYVSILDVCRLDCRHPCLCCFGEAALIGVASVLGSIAPDRLLPLLQFQVQKRHFINLGSKESIRENPSNKVTGRGIRIFRI